MMRARHASIALAALCGCIPAGDKGDGLGPCAIDASGWTVADYNFTDDNIYFGCQPDHEEVFFVTDYFDGLILSTVSAEEAAQLAVGTWDGVWPGAAPWTFTATFDPAQVFDTEDGLSSLIAESGFSEIPERLASKGVTVDENNNVDCDLRFFTEKSDVAGNDSPIPWSHGTNTGYELSTIMTHEIGHCLGLGHPDPGTHTTSIMREELGIGDPIALSNVDRDAIKYLYGEGTLTTPTTPP